LLNVTSLAAMTFSFDPTKSLEELTLGEEEVRCRIYDKGTEYCKYSDFRELCENGELEKIKWLIKKGFSLSGFKYYLEGRVDLNLASRFDPKTFEDFLNFHVHNDKLKKYLKIADDEWGDGISVDGVADYKYENEKFKSYEEAWVSYFLKKKINKDNKNQDSIKDSIYLNFCRAVTENCFGDTKYFIGFLYNSIAARLYKLAKTNQKVRDVISNIFGLGNNYKYNELNFLKLIKKRIIKKEKLEIKKKYDFKLFNRINNVRLKNNLKNRFDDKDYVDLEVLVS
jgi:hypothetical protein